jgi:XTP/dITP diphosphohydrolase
VDGNKIPPLKGGELVIASHNPGKVREIDELLRPFGVTVLAAAGLGLAEPVEDGETFAANALIKARAAARGSGRPALADDSGLVVAALDGAPGIYSARWAGPEKDFTAAMQKIETALGRKGIGAGDRDGRRAHFVCVMALAWPGGPGGETLTFEGRVHGHIIWPPRGDNGFGYDPVFIPDGRKITFGEMEPAEKHKISHRANAFAKMTAACFES